MADGEACQLDRRYGMGWITEAWELFRLCPLTWVGALVAAWIIQTAINTIVELPIQNPFDVFSATLRHGAAPVMQPWQWALYPFIILIQMLVGSYISSGYLRMALAAMRRQLVRIEDVFAGWPSTLRLFGYNVINGTFMAIACGAPAVAIGVCVVSQKNMVLSVAVIVISTLIILAALMIYTYVMMGQVLVVEGARVSDVYRQVFTTMRPHYGVILGVITVMTLLNIAAVCTLGLGWLALAPMWFIVQALIGRDTLGLPTSSPWPNAEWLTPDNEPKPGVWPPPPTA